VIRVKTELVQTLEPQRRIIILRMRVGLLVPAMGRGTKGMVLTLLLRDQETSEPFRLPD
jgi:hypothetical protein